VHIKYLVLFVLPLLFLFLLIIPLLMFIKLTLKKAQLALISMRLRWGYLYNEYKQSAYFWEFVKISTKVLIIISLSLYDDFIVIKGIFIYLFIIIYGLLGKIYKPYEDLNMNSLD